MTETKNEYRPATYGVLEPGLQAAIHLLDRERRNEVRAGEAADAQDLSTKAQTHVVNAMGYKLAIDLLTEQVERLRVMASVESYTIEDEPPEKGPNLYADPKSAA